MNEELQAQLTGILGYIEESVKSAGGFAIEQAPEIVQQLLAWELAENIILSTITVVVFIVSVVFIKKMFPLKKDRWGDVDFGAGLMLAGLIFTSVISFILSICGILAALQIIIAPKIYLIEYAARLMRIVN